MYGAVQAQLRETLDEIRAAGLYKHERQLASPQSSHVSAGGRDVLNFCANNYLGLADHPAVVGAARSALDEWGFGMASVRFICGTQTQHTELESRLSTFLGTDATILFSSCFDANGGVFEVLLDERDAVISDELNHASIIDGIRLCKASRLRYRNRDMADLEAQLQAASGARRRLVVTDGVFSMDGYLAPLDEICALAERYDALVMVDDSHAVGFVGPGGAGTPDLFGVQDRVDINTGTLGKALGGASGGYVSARAEIVELLRQRARPYLFSNAVAPSVVAGSLAALELVTGGGAEREALRANAALFRRLMTEAGFDLLPGEHPIVPVMFGDAALAARVADAMLEHGVYVIAFSYPVVPQGKARIRVQLSAAHSAQDVEQCVAAFTAGRTAVQQPEGLDLPASRAATRTARRKIAHTRTCTSRGVRLQSDDVNERGEAPRELSVGEVAELAHVSIRALHHYDEVGLLRPTQRTAAGHRRYTAADLHRLREILFYRELDFGLDEIAAMLADPGSGTDARLRSQHRMLRERIHRHQRLLVALEKEMEARKMGISLTPEEQFEVFGTDKVGGEWADEAKDRWGETKEFQESQRRTAAYTKDDWARLKEESDAGLQAYRDAMLAGTPATSPAAMALAEENRQFITRWFYDCGYDMQRCLAEMYIADGRFRKTYDDVAPGLAQYVHDAIVANAERHTG